jgi:hypothetical protein
MSWVHWICIIISFCYIANVIPFRALFNSQIFVWRIVTFQFSVWICMRTRYRSDYGFPSLTTWHVCWPVTSVAVFLSLCHSWSLFLTLCEWICVLSVSLALVVTDFCVCRWTELDCRVIQLMTSITNGMISLFCPIRCSETERCIVCNLHPPSFAYLVNSEKIDVCPFAGFSIIF